MSASGKVSPSAAAAPAVPRGAENTIVPFYEPLVVKLLPSGRLNRGTVAPLLDVAAWGVMTEAQCKEQYVHKWFVPMTVGNDEDMYELHDVAGGVESSFWVCVTDAAQIWRAAKRNHKPAWKHVFEEAGLVHGPLGRTSIEAVCIACLGRAAAGFKAAATLVWAAVTLPAEWSGDSRKRDVEPLLSEFLQWKAAEDCPASDLGEATGQSGRKLSAFMTGERRCASYRCSGCWR